MKTTKEIIAELERRAHLCEWVADDLRNKENRDYYLGKAEAYREAITLLEQKKPSEGLEKGCGMEFPHFGARYPDACCINGYLWDLDSYEEGLGLTSGGDDPCPFCNTKEWLEDVVGSMFATEAEALEWVEKMRARYGQKQ